MLVTSESYPGSKGGAGVWQRIISNMPQHTHYVELFVGHGAVLRRKRLAPGTNLGIDIEPTVIDWWKWRTPAGCQIRRADALDVLRNHPLRNSRNALFYIDPPYLSGVRTRDFYEQEFSSPFQHERLLNLVVPRRAMIMISGYWTALYAQMLSGWRHVSYQTMTRGGVRTEYLWMNFDPPPLLHDPRWAGEGFRERERIKKKCARWTAMFAAMPPAERQMIAEALAGIHGNALAADPLTVNGDSRGTRRGRR